MLCVPLRRVHAVERASWETFLYELKADPAGGRLRRPSSRRPRHDGHREPASLTTQAGPAGFMLRCSWRQGMLW
jgi:hypothetical protein